MLKRTKRLFRTAIRTLNMKSIQFIITAAFCLITVFAILFVSVVLYNKFSNTAEQNAKLNTQQIVEQVAINLEDYIKGMSDFFEVVDNKIASSESVPNQKLAEQLETIISTREDIVSLALFTSDGRLVTDISSKPMRKNTNLTEQSWFKAALDNPNHLSFSLPHVQNLFQGPYKWVVSMSKQVKIVSGGKTINAVLLVDVNFKTIDDLCQRVSLGKKGYVYVLDDSAGNIVYHPQQQLIYAGLKYENVELALKYTFGSIIDTSAGDARLLTIRTVNNIGWKIVGVSYMDEIVTTKKEISGFMIWLLLLVLLAVIVVSALMSAKIAQPIKKLKTSMEKVERGNFDVHIDVHGTIEVEQLSRRFNLMISRIRQLMDQIILEQEVKRKYELEVLQSQINPHFLYNTLNSAVRMAGSGKSEEVITTITSLSKFFRISLSKGKRVITVQEELEHVRNYLIIQKMRYKNKFNYDIRADGDVLHCKTMKLILQPIVENAIYHGIEKMADEGFIQIKAEIANGKVLLQIADNGLGIPPGIMDNLLSGFDKGDGKDSGVGIKNVHERIKLFFGADYGLEIESELEIGTTVKIWIPLIREEEGYREHE